MLNADFVRVGRTPVFIKLAVYAERNYADPVIVKVAEGGLTDVAINRSAGKLNVPANIWSEM